MHSRRQRQARQPFRDFKRFLTCLVVSISVLTAAIIYRPRCFELRNMTTDHLNRSWCVLQILIDQHFITKGLEGGALQPIISKTFSLSEMVEAHQYMESNAQIGKIVIEL